jgi:tRNA threonylcarbamoyladenosine biosynthesis protein TsaB
VNAADFLLKSAGLKPADLEMAACMKGPGSWTGLRIGFAAVKALGTALNVKKAAVPTLDCMAYPFRTTDALVLPAIDARRDRFYAAFFHRGRALTPAMDAPASEIAALAAALAQEQKKLGHPGRITLTGPGARMLKEQMDSLAGRLAAPVNMEVDRNFFCGQALNVLHFLEENATMCLMDDGGGPFYVRGI